MSLVARARSTPGTLRQEILVDGRFRLATDEPLSLGGGDTAPTPHELLPAALAACVATTLERYARTKGWRLGEIEVEVDYEQAERPRQCAIVVRIEAPLSTQQVARLERVAASCPVRQALEGGVAFAERIEAAVSSQTA